MSPHDSSRLSLVTSTAVLATGTIALISIYRSRQRSHYEREVNTASLKDPPTPPTRHWIFGHALALQPSPEGPKNISHDIIFRRWMHKLNSKVVMFQLPVIGRFIIVGDAEVARYVLSTRGFHKSPTYKTLIPLVGAKSILVTEGNEWTSQRRMYNPGFSPDFLRHTVDIIIEKCNRFLEKCDEDAKEDRATDMLARTIDLTSDVIAAVGLGEDWDMYDPTNKGFKTSQKIRDLSAVVGESMSNPLKRYFNLKHMLRTRSLSVAVEHDMQQLVQRRLATLCTSHDDDVENQKDILTVTLASLLRTKKKVSKKAHVDVPTLSRDDMLNMTSQLKSFFFAGHDTTATTISWAFWLLLQHPNALERARNEVLTSLGEDWAENAMFGKKLNTTTYEELQKCEYLDAITRETLRLYPPAATTRYTTDPNANAEGYILGNSIVHLNFYAIQRDPDVWEDPDEFLPERFMGAVGKKRVASSAYLPFSKGSRDCIGKYFALLETKATLAALICRYDGEVVEPNEVYAARITSIPLDGCKVALRRRGAD